MPLCSGVAAWGRATVDGELVTISSGDHDPSFTVTVIALPETGNHYMFCPFGATGDVPKAGQLSMVGHPGMNDKGLSYVHHGGGPKWVEPKKYWGYGIRRAVSVLQFFVLPTVHEKPLIWKWLCQLATSGREIPDIRIKVPGHLVRFSLLHSPERSDLVICAHHAICDGMSLTYLIRDILQQLADPDREVEILPEPAAITRDTVPSPPPANFIAKGVIGLFNKLWTRRNIKLDSNDLKKLHRVFWEKNRDAGVLVWESSIAETKALVSRCRAENVTVNTALWTAFLAAQYEVQGDAEPYRTSAGLAVSTRDKLTAPVGEAFGFYASSLTTHLEYDPCRTFWDTARLFHQEIGDNLAKTNIFRSLSAELLAPTLLDSLYFSKYGLIKSRLSDKLLQQMNWRGISYGYAITNVGRMNIPTSYGQYHLESVYGPFVYSDVNEKTMGVITVGDKVTFLMSYNETIVTPHTAEEIRKTAMECLSNAVN